MVQGIMMAVMFVIQLFIRPKAQKPKPQSFDGDSFPQCEDGKPKTIGFGQCKKKDFIVISANNFRTKAITSKGGKKG